MLSAKNFNVSCWILFRIVAEAYAKRGDKKRVLSIVVFAFFSLANTPVIMATIT